MFFLPVLRWSERKTSLPGLGAVGRAILTSESLAYSLALRTLVATSRGEAQELTTS
jgi:hypothetical protein